MANEFIQLLIMDEYQKLKFVELSNWDGVAYLGSRKHIPLMQKIEQLRNPGIYFLLGENVETGKKILYIGESENVANRFQSHASSTDKEWFEDFIVFTSKKGDINKAHVKYLEAVFMELARGMLTTIDLDNGCGSNTKKDNKLPIFDVAKAEGFKERIIFILNNLNLINFVSNENKEKSASVNGKEVFYMNLKRNNKDKQARLIILDNGYQLLKGSYASREIVPSFEGMSACNKREELIKQGLLVEQDGVYVATEDIYFKSPSGASDIVAGSSSNGRIEWKLLDGTTLNDFEQNLNKEVLT